MFNSDLECYYNSLILTLIINNLSVHACRCNALNEMRAMLLKRGHTSRELRQTYKLAKQKAKRNIKFLENSSLFAN